MNALDALQFYWSRNSPFTKAKNIKTFKIPNVISEKKFACVSILAGWNQMFVALKRDFECYKGSSRNYVNWWGEGISIQVASNILGAPFQRKILLRSLQKYHRRTYFLESPTSRTKFAINFDCELLNRITGSLSKRREILITFFEGQTQSKVVIDSEFWTPSAINRSFINFR